MSNYKKGLVGKFGLEGEKLIFSTKAMWALLVPIMLEQLLNSFMGMADTMMVSRVGAEAVSAVSLVDSINILVIQVFSALAAGATIICSQYIGHGNKDRSNEAARQVTITVLAISLAITTLCIVLCKPLLSAVFGRVSESVMACSVTYFQITSLSFPFIALFNAGAAFFRAGGESKFPMKISIISNFLNVFGNAILIFVFHMGVKGAALSTLVSRMFCMLVVFYYLRKPKQIIVLRDYLSFKPDIKLIIKILAVGIPSGVENGMFQFGKLAIQSSVSTLGTPAIAAQALTIIFENVNGVGGMGMGIGLMTIVGQCIGAGEKQQAKYYVAKVTGYAWLVELVSCIFVYIVAKPVIILAGLSPQSAAMCQNMIGWITVIKPIVWTFSFIPAYGLRAAGDVKFSMLVSTMTMWFCRVALAVCLIRYMGFGPIAVWIGMFADWTIRSIIFISRYMSGRWLEKKLV